MPIRSPGEEPKSGRRWVAVTLIAIGMLGVLLLAGSLILYFNGPLVLQRGDRYTQVSCMWNPPGDSGWLTAGGSSWETGVSYLQWGGPRARTFAVVGRGDQAWFRFGPLVWNVFRFRGHPK